MERLMKDWAAWIELQGMSPGSPADHRVKLGSFLKFIGDADPCEVSREQIAAYQSHLFEKVSDLTGKKLACNTQINNLSALKNFYRFLHQTGRIAINPTDVVVLPRHPKLLPPVLLKSREMKRLLDAPDLGNPLGFRDRTIMEVLYATGMRLGELVALQVDDLDFEQGLIRIQCGKGQKPRIVPMGEAAASWLTRYVEEVRPVLADGSKTKTLFFNRFKKPLQKCGWHKKLLSYLQDAGIKKKFTSHGFRHAVATAMLERGADMRHIQELLGHDNLTTTERYLHVVKAELKRIHGKTHPREQLPLSPVRYARR